MRDSDMYPKILYILKSGQNKFWIDYDEEADVLYIDFESPSYAAVEHNEGENGIVRNFDEAGNLTGFTIIVAKRFLEAPASEKRGWWRGGVG